MTTIVLWADRFEDCRDFYAALLNAECLDESKEFVRVAGLSGEVLLHRVPAQWATDISTAAEVRSESPIKPVFLVDSIARARSAVSKFEGQIYSPDTEQRHAGITYCDGFDPDGNVIQLAQKG